MAAALSQRQKIFTLIKIFFNKIGFRNTSNHHHHLVWSIGFFTPGWRDWQLLPNKYDYHLHQQLIKSECTTYMLQHLLRKRIEVQLCFHPFILLISISVGGHSQILKRIKIKEMLHCNRIMSWTKSSFCYDLQYWLLLFIY